MELALKLTRRKRNPKELTKEAADELKVANDPEEVCEKYSFEDNVGLFTKEKRILFSEAICAHKRDKSRYYVICPKCGNLLEVKDYRNDTKCPACGEEFNPNGDGNVDGRYYICTNPDCGQRNVIVEAVRRTGKPKERLYAIESYCPHCGAKEYKQADD